MTTAEVSSALSTRRTVRIVYQRSTDTYAVRLVEPGDTEGGFHCGALGDGAEQWCEQKAANLARHHGLDITRMDIP